MATQPAYYAGPSLVDHKVLLIQNKVRRLLEKNVMTGGEPALQLPSAIELSGIFGCSELEVLAALNRLQQEGFEYHLKGLDSPIFLKDTLRSRGPSIAETLSNLIGTSGI